MIQVLQRVNITEFYDNIFDILYEHLVINHHNHLIILLDGCEIDETIIILIHICEHMMSLHNSQLAYLIESS